MAKKTAVQKRVKPAPRRKKPVAKPVAKPSPGREFAERIVGMLESKLAGNAVIVDVRGKSNVTDFFVIASGNNLPHVRAMYEEVIHQLKHEGTPCYGKSDNFESGWLVLDYVDVVVHIMLDEMRKRYAIEDLWAESAPQTRPTRRSKPRRPANPRG